MLPMMMLITITVTNNDNKLKAYSLGSGNFVFASHAETISTKNLGVTTCFSETNAHIT